MGSGGNSNSSKLFLIPVRMNLQGPSKNEGHKNLPNITLWIFSIWKPEFYSDLAQNCTPMMLQMKFDFDWPAGLRDIHV